MTQIWVTKYALTAGVFKIDAKLSNTGEMASFKRKEAAFGEYAHGKDFHLTEDAARLRFEEMRKKKQESLVKQKAKIDNLTFSVHQG